MLACSRQRRIETNALALASVPVTIKPLQSGNKKYRSRTYRPELLILSVAGYSIRHMSLNHWLAASTEFQKHRHAGTSAVCHSKTKGSNPAYAESLSRSGLQSNPLLLAARPHFVQICEALQTSSLYAEKSAFSCFFISHRVFDMGTVTSFRRSHKHAKAEYEASEFTQNVPVGSLTKVSPGVQINVLADRSYRAIHQQALHDSCVIAA